MTNPEAPKLTELLHGTDTAMMVTRAGDSFDGRPMQIVSIEANDTLLFATAIGSEKVREIHECPDVALAFQSGRNHIFVRGFAEITQHKGLIDRLWSDSWKTWYPQGKDDPTLCILVFRPHEAMSWDNSGAEAQHFAFESGSPSSASH